MSDEYRNGYSHEEHELLMDAAATVLLATVAADRSGPVAYFSEMTAAGTFLYDAQRRYRQNRLVQELYARQQEREIPAEQGQVTRESLLRDIDRVAAVLRRDTEGMEFRRFLIELAERTAKASRNWWFGPRVSAEEAAFLADLRRRLAVDG
jgi:hypothetical protein